MPFRTRRFQVLRAALACAACLLVSACQFVDLAVEPRTYEVNLGTQNVREELILLNVVRASRFEPLNFTALSKYTATGQLAVSGSAQNNIGIDFAAFRGGPAAGQLVGSSPKTALNAGGSMQTGNSFDLVPLDTQDFYSNFLATLTAEKIYLLVNAGISRDVVFHSLLRSIDVNLTPEGKARAKGFSKLRYVNDPSNDTWLTDDTKTAFERCAREAELDRVEAVRLNGRWAPFYTPFWYGEHLNDCSYHKFLSLLRTAFEYGVTTYALSKEEQAARDAKAANARPNQINITVASTPQQGERAEQRVIVLCFDAAVAAHSGVKLTSKSQCGDRQAKGPLQTHLGRFDESAEPVLRSAYGVFQYYGGLLKTQTRVDLSIAAQRRTRDPNLFNITSEALGCFARVDYAGKGYCVPAESAENTKEVLTLLVALVNLSTSRNSLPVTPTVLVNP